MHAIEKIFWGLSQLLAKSDELATYPGFDGADRYPQVLRNLSMRTSIDNRQDQARAPFWLELFEIGLRCRNFGECGMRTRWRSAFDCMIDDRDACLDGDLTAGVSNALQRSVANHRINPSASGAAGRIEASGVPQYLGEGIVDYVFGMVAVADNAPGELAQLSGFIGRRFLRGQICCLPRIRSALTYM